MPNTSNILLAAVFTLGLVFAIYGLTSDNSRLQIVDVLPVKSIATKPFNRASKIIGAPVFVAGNQEVGAVNDIVLDDAHKMTAITVDVGGFVGIDGGTVAIPVTDLAWSEKDGQFQIATSLTGADLREALAK